jgi:hypothetical protein
MRHTLLLSTAILVAVGVTAASAADDKDALIKDALSAAPPEIAKTAMVMDWDHSMLKNGSGPYTCMPSDPNTRAKGGRDPMCADKVWEAWADAFANKKPFKATGTGIAYMLAGDKGVGASNIDPYATAATPTNQWVIEGPHVMVIVPDAAQLEGLSTDPNNGGAYVMWKGTPYAHIMVPVAERSKQ